MRDLENSIPVQSRVNAMALAEMVEYWSEEGYYIRSMSQLVNLSVDLCAQILEINGKLPIVIDSIVKADEVLRKRGLYQKSLNDRTRVKIDKAARLELLNTLIKDKEIKL
jgi:hypothetical protein